jgi:metalloendopeptidase OMA1, mitochondrial
LHGPIVSNSWFPQLTLSTGLSQLGEEVRRTTAEEYRGKILPPNHLLTQHVRRVASRLLEANDLGSLRPDRGEEFVPDSGEESGLLHDQGGWQNAGGGKLREWTVFVVDEERIANAFAAYGKFSLPFPLVFGFHSLQGP